MTDPAARAFVFPGQGSQEIGMGRAVAEASPAARAVFEAVDAALGESLSGLMWDGDADTLTLTENAQPALMAVSLAVLRAIEERSGRAIDQLVGHVAGHSLGEYSALAAAGALSIEDAARLLRLRGQAMQRAVPVGAGAMAAVLGLDLDAARAVAEAATADGGVCVAANDNAPGQIVLSGDAAAVERAIALAGAKGAKRSVLLPVSAPFHSPLMAPAAEEMRAALAELDVRAPVVPVVCNVTAAPTVDPGRIRDLLVEQVTASVRWRECVLAMAAAGVGHVVEIGAGKVLSGLNRRIDKTLASTSIQSPEDVDAFVATVG